MAKRFIDTDIFRKPLLRGLEAPYKALWVYLLCECDHAGVWDVELDVASVRLGMKLDPASVVQKFGGAVLPIDGGTKWYLVDFVAFQYGTLNPANRVHASVLAQLERYGIDWKNQAPSKPLPSPFQGAMDKDKDKDMVKEGVQGKPKTATAPAAALPFPSEAFAAAAARWERHKREKRDTITPSSRAAWLEKCRKLGEAAAIEAIDHSIAGNYSGMFPPRTEATPAAERRQATEPTPGQAITLGQRHRLGELIPPTPSTNAAPAA